VVFFYEKKNGHVLYEVSNRIGRQLGGKKKSGQLGMEPPIVGRNWKS